MVHDRVRPFQCQLCEWSFGEKRDLQSHVSPIANHTAIVMLWLEAQLTVSFIG